MIYDFGLRSFVISEIFSDEKGLPLFVARAVRAIEQLGDVGGFELKRNLLERAARLIVVSVRQ